MRCPRCARTSPIPMRRPATMWCSPSGTCKQPRSQPLPTWSSGGRPGQLRDDRSMAAEALARIGPERVLKRPEIVEQLRRLDADPNVTEEFSQRIKKLLNDLKPPSCSAAWEPDAPARADPRWRVGL